MNKFAPLFGMYHNNKIIWNIMGEIQAQYEMKIFFFYQNHKTTHCFCLLCECTVEKIHSRREDWQSRWRLTTTPFIQTNKKWIFVIEIVRETPFFMLFRWVQLYVWKWMNLIFLLFFHAICPQGFKLILLNFMITILFRLCISNSFKTKNPNILLQLKIFQHNYISVVVAAAATTTTEEVMDKRNRFC